MLVMAAKSVILATIYGPDAAAGAASEAKWSGRLHAVLQDSTVGRTLIGLVTPVMEVIFGPLTPQVVHDAIR
ncbi:hypothetical protein BH24CHL8_BH24CHL8_11240 [soil metagenome]